MICPDCLGNRDFCLDGLNAFRPDYRMENVVQATLQALRLDEGQRHRLLRASKKTALQHSASEERKAFVALLRNNAQAWADRSGDRCAAAQSDLST